MKKNPMTAPFTSIISSIFMDDKLIPKQSPMRIKEYIIYFTGISPFFAPSIPIALNKRFLNYLIFTC